MRKMMILILLLILDLSSIVGYVYLNKNIIAGEIKIAEGKIQIARGESMLAKGKAKLNQGQRKLARAKNVHNTVQSVPFMKTINRVPILGTPSNIVRNKISTGDKLVAKGKNRISSGESQLAAGKLELQKGIERLNRASVMRTLCLMGGVFFTALLITLGIYWRRSFTKQP